MDYSYCAERLPCGVCKQTGDICPLNRMNLGYGWGVSIKPTTATSSTPTDIFSKTEVTDNG